MTLQQAYLKCGCLGCEWIASYDERQIDAAEKIMWNHDRFDVLESQEAWDQAMFEVLAYLDANLGLPPPTPRR